MGFPASAHGAGLRLLSGGDGGALSSPWENPVGHPCRAMGAVPARRGEAVHAHR